MGVGLVADVPHQPVFGCVVQVVQGDRQLDGTEVRSEVTAIRVHRLDDEVSDLGRQFPQLVICQIVQVARLVDAFEVHEGRVLSSVRRRRCGVRQG